MKFIIFILYDIILLISFVVYLPVYFWRSKITLQALREKLGFITRPAQAGSKLIWLQAVSVGESILIENLLRRLQEVVKAAVVISTTTVSGYKLAHKKYADSCSVIYFPLDISWIVSSVIKKINPQIFIAMETEIWPNVFRILHQKRIPILILNARISDKAFIRYRRIGWLLKAVLRQCSCIGAQNELYKQRYIQLGADPEKISVTGNLKLSSIVVDEKKLATVKKYTPYLKSGSRLLWLAASTHKPEEDIIIDVYKDVVKNSSICSLLIAPRHPERVAVIEQQVISRGFIPVRFSRLSEVTVTDNMIFLVDTVGDLLYLYSIADICFVGGSLSGNGGHNILEPMYFLKPTIFGPSMNNFTDIAENALEYKAAIMVNDAYELRSVVRRLLDNEAMRQSLANRCSKIFECGENILKDNLELILNCMAKKT